MRNTNVFFDTNVVIDIIVYRGQFTDTATQIFEMCRTGLLHGNISTQSICDIFYILRNDYTAAELKDMFYDVCKVLEVVGCEKSYIMYAFADNAFRDFEDCVIAKCAEDIGCDYIITRDPKGFAASRIAVATPQEFLDKMRV